MNRNWQITCWCNAYEFPHRLNGGKCNTQDWAENIFQEQKFSQECVRCHCNRFAVCEVATGQESIDHCEVYNELKRKQEPYSNDFEPPDDIWDLYPYET